MWGSGTGGDRGEGGVKAGGRGSRGQLRGGGGAIEPPKTEGLGEKGSIDKTINRL